MGKQSLSANKVKVKIVNIVVTSDLKSKLNLEKISTKLAHTEYNPEQFPGLVLKIKEPRSSALLFTSGKIVCTGTNSLEQAKKAVNNLIRAVNRIGYRIELNPVLSVQNMVAAGGLGINLNLNQLAMKLRNVEYEPEQFPGLVYKIKEPKASFLLFTNGKIVCTGIKTKQELNDAIVKLVKDLKKVK